MITFNPKLKIENACAKKDIRGALNQPHFDMAKSNLVATDGHILAVVPVPETTDDHGGPVPLDAIKEARKKANLTPAGEAGIELNGSAKITSGAQYPIPTAPEFPDYQRVIPDNASAFEVALNADLLKRLADAITTDGLVRLQFQPQDTAAKPDATKSIRVQPLTDDVESHGVIMPCRLSD